MSDVAHVSDVRAVQFSFRSCQAQVASDLKLFIVFFVNKCRAGNHDRSVQLGVKVVVPVFLEYYVALLMFGLYVRHLSEFRRK